ncbi:MAG: hypothetical protein AB3N10_21770, partial [Allomuricauda sp.]
PTKQFSKKNQKKYKVLITRYLQFKNQSTPRNFMTCSKIAIGKELKASFLPFLCIRYCKHHIKIVSLRTIQNKDNK